jgi:ankyrin repeat protein
LEAVKYILSLGSDIDAVDKRGNTAMHGAAYKHAPAVVEYLDQQGANISIWDQENDAGHTPLIIAAGIYKEMSIVRSLVTEAVIQELMDRYASLR